MSSPALPRGSTLRSRPSPPPDLSHTTSRLIDAFFSTRKSSPEARCAPCASSIPCHSRDATSRVRSFSITDWEPSRTSTVLRPPRTARQATWRQPRESFCASSQKRARRRSPASRSSIPLRLPPTRSRAETSRITAPHTVQFHRCAHQLHRQLFTENTAKNHRRAAPCVL